MEEQVEIQVSEFQAGSRAPGGSNDPTDPTDLGRESRVRIVVLASRIRRIAAAGGSMGQPWVPTGSVVEPSHGRNIIQSCPPHRQILTVKTVHIHPCSRDVSISGGI